MKKVKDKSKRIVLAHGEVTGHAHAIYDVEAAEFDGSTLKILKNGAALEHEEHTTHEFEIGTADVDIQLEYSESTIRRQVD